MENESPSNNFILCAEDEPIAQEIIDACLSDIYTLKFVSDGQQCLDAIDERMPKLILLDIKMPVMDGREACIRIKKNPKTKHIPIIIISAYCSDLDMTEMLDLGVSHFISKPFDIDELVAIIKDFCTILKS